MDQITYAQRSFLTPEIASGVAHLDSHGGTYIESAE